MMGGSIHWTALWVFVFFFALVTVMGFAASRWQGGGTKEAHLNEWGLGGRDFGTWITWLLVADVLCSAARRLHRVGGAM
jgi:SSS family solute:Na+ symporter